MIKYIKYQLYTLYFLKNIIFNILFRLVVLLWKSDLCNNKNKIRNVYGPKEREFKEVLDDLFDITHSNAMNIIIIDEENKFLLL